MKIALLHNQNNGGKVTMDIMQEVYEIFDQTVKWRRDFHRHPELGNQEIRTAKIVAKHLKSLGIEVTERVGSTGVVGLLKGSHPGKVIGIRADMDALPIQEATGLPYASENEGVMHACGHDGHTAMLMATATILARHRDQLSGSVKFLFQPAEEGGQGAQRMVEAGALKNPRPDAIIAAHVMGWDAGHVKIRKGYSHLSSDNFCIRLSGKGGHAAKPHECSDTLLAACKLVCDIQMIAARKINPLDTVTITVGRINGGTAENIISGQAEIAGTIRTLKHEVRERAIEALHEISRGVCKSLGTTYELVIYEGNEAVYNTPELMAVIETAAKKVLAKENISRADQPRPGSEDFSAFLTDGIPGGYFWLGAAYPGENPPSSNHQPTYNWDENAMKAGIAVEVAVVFEFLGS